MSGIDAPAWLPSTPQTPYFGHATFHDYYLRNNGRGYAYEGMTVEQAWAGVLAKLATGVHLSVAEWVKKERGLNPQYRLGGAPWYFIMPEARTTIPADLLAEVDAATGHLYA